LIFNFLNLSFHKEELVKLSQYPPILLKLENVHYMALDFQYCMKFISNLFISMILRRNRKETPPKSQVYTLRRHRNTILYYTCFYIVLNFIFWRGLFAPPLIALYI